MLDFSFALGIIIPVLATQRISVTVAHRTLTPFAGVRIPHPLPKNTQPHPWLGVFWQRIGFEEDGRAKRGKKHAGGMFFSPGENPWPCERTRMGVGARPLCHRKADSRIRKIKSKLPGAAWSPPAGWRRILYPHSLQECGCKRIPHPLPTKRPLLSTRQKRSF